LPHFLHHLLLGCDCFFVLFMSGSSFDLLMSECGRCKFRRPIESPTCEMCLRESLANEALLREATRVGTTQPTSSSARKRARKRARDAAWPQQQSPALHFIRTFGL